MTTIRFQDNTSSASRPSGFARLIFRAIGIRPSASANPQPSLPTIYCRCHDFDEVNACRALARAMGVPFRIASATAFVEPAQGVTPFRFVELELEFAGEMVILSPA